MSYKINKEEKRVTLIPEPKNYLKTCFTILGIGLVLAIVIKGY